MLPSNCAEPERYEGRPLLVILENYVLDTIGALSAEQSCKMQGIVERVWPGPDWRDTVRKTLNLKPAMDDSIRKLWETSKVTSKSASAPELTPVQFAKMLVDKNFSHLIPPIEQ